MLASIMAVIDAGDEVVVFSPFYENYGPDCILAGAVPRFVTLHEPDWSIDPDELRAAFSNRTRGIVVNTPHNPTGKVFSLQELQLIAELCQEHDAVAFTDEIYEHLVYEGSHISLATLPGMRERTITINGLSKTFSVTGSAAGLCHCSTRPERRHPQGPRLHDHRRRCAAPARGGCRVAPAIQLLLESAGGLSRST